MTGTIQWDAPTSATTKFKGKINGNQFKFEEFEVVTGDVEVPRVFNGSLTPEGALVGTLSGKNATFTINLA